MRILVTFSMNPEKGDQLIKEGRIGETMGSILEELQPEAAYFTDVDGTRGGFLVVDMEDASQIPAITEPLFLQVGATVPYAARNDPRRPEGCSRGCTRAHGTKVRLEPSE